MGRFVGGLFGCGQRKARRERVSPWVCMAIYISVWTRKSSVFFVWGFCLFHFVFIGVGQWSGCGLNLCNSVLKLDKLSLVFIFSSSIHPPPPPPPPFFFFLLKVGFAFKVFSFIYICLTHSIYFILYKLAPPPPPPPIALLLLSYLHFD